MRSRQDLVEIFSTFLKLQGSKANVWQSEPQLKRSMVQAIQHQDNQGSKAVWVIYWYQQQIQKPHSAIVQRAQRHLLAYIQEACYWASYRFHQKVSQFSGVSSYGFEDYFQIAQIRFPKVISGFSPERGASLETYAEIAFQNHLRDVVRQQKALGMCSNWSLLRSVSRKRLLETLESQGLSSSAIQQYSLVWLHFKESWLAFPSSSKSQRRQASPTPEQWQAIAQSYNQSKSPEEEAAKPQQIEQWLSQLARWVRSALYPSFQSLNQPQFGEAGEEKLERLVDTDTEAIHEPSLGSSALLSTLMLQEEQVERQKQRSQMQTVLEATLPTLKANWKTAMELYYREDLIQSEIAKRMGCSQPSVARYLMRARETLLCALVSWAEQTLNILPDPDLIRQQGEALDEWLKLRYNKG